MAWCEKCHYGSQVCAKGRCPQCGGNICMDALGAAGQPVRKSDFLDDDKFCGGRQKIVRTRRQSPNE